MTDAREWLLMQAQQWEDQHAPQHLTIGLRTAAQEMADMASRYDEAIERIHNLTAELEYLRLEVNRG